VDAAAAIATTGNSVVDGCSVTTGFAVSLHAHSSLQYRYRPVEVQ